jgi:hypothetical protein
MQQAINKVESVIYRGSVQCNVHSDSIIARNFLLIRRVLTDRNMQLHLHVARAGTCDVDLRPVEMWNGERKWKEATTRGSRFKSK